MKVEKVNNGKGWMLASSENTVELIVNGSLFRLSAKIGSVVEFQIWRRL